VDVDKPEDLELARRIAAGDQRLRSSSATNPPVAGA
jgi:hypothetical protein